MNIEKELLKIIKKIDGKVLFIGYDDNKINKAILNNDNITMCDIFSVHKSTKKNKGEFDQRRGKIDPNRRLRFTDALRPCNAEITPHILAS